MLMIITNIKYYFNKIIVSMDNLNMVRSFKTNNNSNCFNSSNIRSASTNTKHKEEDNKSEISNIINNSIIGRPILNENSGKDLINHLSKSINNTQVKHNKRGSFETEDLENILEKYQNSINEYKIKEKELQMLSKTYVKLKDKFKNINKSLSEQKDYYNKLHSTNKNIIDNVLSYLNKP